MTLAIFLFSGNVPVWNDKLTMCVVYDRYNYIFIESTIDGITVSLAFTTDITSRSSTGERNIYFLFLQAK